jgi:hypothetical protein
MASASLIWNIINTIRTSSLATAKSARDFELREFDTLARAPISQALAKLVGRESAVRALLLNDDSKKIADGAVALQIDEMQPAYDELDAAIRRAEALPVFGGLIDLAEPVSAAWDNIAESMSGFYQECLDHLSADAATKAVCQSLREMDRIVLSRLSDIARCLASNTSARRGS